MATHVSFWQIRTSYLPNEILWGHRFEHESMLYDQGRHTYSILHNSMNKTAVDDTPKMSAKQMQEDSDTKQD